MIVAGALLAGATVSWLLWHALAAQFEASPVLRRTNYRGHELPIASGVVIVLAVVIVGAVASIAASIGGWSVIDENRIVAVTAGATLGFGLIGLLDDLVGAVATKGVYGHVGELLRGRVTTGLVKLVWGVLVGVLAVAAQPIARLDGDAWALVRGGLLIAACANVVNLFDRAPGRAIKISMLGTALLVVVGLGRDAGFTAWELTGPMLVLGAGVGLLFVDLRERCMLGDTGSNVLGAAVGMGLVITLADTGQWIALATAVGINAASEFVSFTRVIDAVGPLRWLDRLGATPQRRAHPRQ